MINANVNNNIQDYLGTSMTLKKKLKSWEQDPAGVMSATALIFSFCPFLNSYELRFEQYFDRLSPFKAAAFEFAVVSSSLQCTHACTHNCRTASLDSEEDKNITILRQVLHTLLNTSLIFRWIYV